MSIQERTHDISLVGSHIKDLDAWASILNQSISASHPRAAGSRYTDVIVLLLRWEDDDLDVVNEISELDDTFRSVYGYRTEQWKIPSTQSHIALVRRILDLLTHPATGDKLLIVYYGGHGYMNDQRDCVWMANRKPQAATAQWSSIQTTLGQADSDVLILLDCCAAGSSAGNPSEGHTEIMGACGFDSDTPGVGDHSFTRSLIEELRYYGERRRHISTAFLYSKIFARAKDSWILRFERNADSERRRTPIHIHLADSSKQRCIELTPMAPLLPPSRYSLGLPTTSSQLSSAVQSSATSTSPLEDVDMSDPAESDPSQSSETSIESQELRPRVLISVALEQEHILRTEDWIDWLKSFPALARWIHLEGAYVSDSNLLLISLPVVLWDMLPKHPAISFISFVRSRNLLTSDDRPAGYQGTGSSKLESLDTLNVDTPLEKDLFDPAEMPSLWQRFKNDLHWSFLSKAKPARRKTSNESLATTLVGSSDGLIPPAARVAVSGAISRDSAARRPLIAAEGITSPKAIREWKTSFAMVVHRPDGTSENCTTHIDTGGEVDVISTNVVESLGLSKEEYKGTPLKTAMFTVEPRWQTTFDWHVAGFHRTYKSTFVVLDEEHCGDFEIIIGRRSIEALGLYSRNDKVW